MSAARWIALAVVACAPAVQHPAAKDCGQPVPLGAQSMATLAPGPDVDAPQLCDYGKWSQGGAWIRVHAHGKRHFDYSKQMLDTPEMISIHVFGEAVRQAFVARFGEMSGGFGLGVCGDIHAGLDEWNLSSRVFDWAQADDAVRIVEEQLAKFDVADDYGVSVTGIDCSISL